MADLGLIFLESLEQLDSRSLHDLIELIFHVLRVSNFTFPDHIPMHFIENIYSVIRSKLFNNPLPTRTVTFNTSDNVIENINEIVYETPIIDCDDKILKLAFLRDQVKDIQQTTNALVYKKLKYHFDNVYNNDNSRLTPELITFIDQRVKANKPVSIVLCGYTGSGKSTICNDVLSNINAQKYSLYQIYINRGFVFDNGHKRLLKASESFNDDKFNFNADSENMKKILHNFCITAQTDGNKNSSRSHTIINCYINAPNGKEVKISILDLAGYERNKKKGLFAKESQESLYINKSLFNLTSYIKDDRHRDNKCLLLQCVKGIKNICFILLFHDHPELSLYSCNHLVMLKDLYKITKFKQ